MRVQYLSLLASWLSFGAEVTFTVTRATDSNGATVGRLDNNGACAIAATVFLFEYSSSTGHRAEAFIRDYLLSGRSNDLISIGQGRDVKFPPSLRPAQIEVRWGALCDQGRQIGDPELAEMILARRIKVRRDIPEAMARIQALERMGASHGDYVEQIREWHAQRWTTASRKGMPSSMRLEAIPALIHGRISDSVIDITLPRLLLDAINDRPETASGKDTAHALKGALRELASRLAVELPPLATSPTTHD